MPWPPAPLRRTLPYSLGRSGSLLPTVHWLHPARGLCAPLLSLPACPLPAVPSSISAHGLPLKEALAITMAFSPTCSLLLGPLPCFSLFLSVIPTESLKSQGLFRAHCSISVYYRTWPVVGTQIIDRMDSKRSNTLASVSWHSPLLWFSQQPVKVEA